VLDPPKRKLKPAVAPASPPCACADIQPMAAADAHFVALALIAAREENTKLRAENLELRHLKYQLEKLVRSTLAAARTSAQAAEQAAEILVERRNEYEEEGEEGEQVGAGE